MKKLYCVALVGLLASAWIGAQGAPLPEAKPEAVGLSSQRLERVGALVQQATQSGDLAGAVVMIARDGKLVYQRAVGMQDVAKGVPMAPDSIFRIYSMTKPIVSVAAMTLVEEGGLGLHEPVSKYIPEFKDMRVAVENIDAQTGTTSFSTVPAKRPMTVHDLLRHTSGLIYGLFSRNSELGKLYEEANLFAQPTLDAFCRALAKLPLRYDPGTVWHYGHSTDVLGRVVEVASGQPLDAFVAERVLRPLKMADTGWYVPPDKLNRFAQPRPGTEKNWDPAVMLDFTKPATMFAGGHGMVSTAGDYLRFAQMLANGGELDGVRILSRKTVAYMTSDHTLNAGIERGPAYLPGWGYGFGLGFAVRETTGASQWPGSVGDFYWGGYAGTYFWVDPQERLVPIMMFQAPEKRQHYRVLFRGAVYQAIVN